MSGVDVVQSAASVAIVLFGSAAFWGYWKDRRKTRAEGAVATATVEIQIEASRVANLEQRFAFAQRAWDDERASLTRRIVHLEDELAEERRDHLEDKLRHEDQVRTIEERVSKLTEELGAVTTELGGRNGRPG